MDDSAVDLFLDPDAEAERLKEESRKRRQAILEKFKTSGESGKSSDCYVYVVLMECCLE